MKRILILSLVIFTVISVGCLSPTESGNIEVDDVWGRSSPNAAQNGAIYMVISNNTNRDDQLVGAMTDACAAVEVHEMDMDENGVMVMGQVPGGIIDLPAGESVEFQVGGLHVMCIDKQLDFTAGETFPVTLEFANVEDMEVMVEIRDTAEGGMDMEEMDMDDMGEEEMDMDSE